MSRVVLHVMGVVFLVFLCSDLSAVAAGTMGKKGDVSAASSRDRSKRSLLVERILAAGDLSRMAFYGSKARTQGNVQRAQAPHELRPRVVHASLRSDGHPDAVSDSSEAIPGSQGRLLPQGCPAPAIPREALNDTGKKLRPHRSPALLERGQMESLLMPGQKLRSVGNLPSAPPETPQPENRKLLEIEVSHSSHLLRLLLEQGGNTRVLQQCSVGLGSTEFPTPVGVYYVTHIYDEDPWWIPPPNRAWAAGQSPSRRVYGGTMAPLLKKRSVRSKHKQPIEGEDEIEGAVKLEDYGYRFHGTNAPRSIGRNQSHGCVRMLPADAKTLASLIKDNVGVAHRRESANGSFVILKSPVRLNLIK
jgi:hypothetical protein